MGRPTLLVLVCSSLLSLSPLHAQTTADPYTGTFSDGNLTITINANGSRYSGRARVPEGEFTIAAQKVGGRLIGSYTIEGTNYLFQASLRGNVMTLTAEGQTYSLERQASGSEAAAGPTPSRGTAMSGRDAQLTELLLRSRWCHFTYRGSTNNTGSGSSYQENVSFNRDGTAQVRTGGENYSSGSAGSVGSQRSGGTMYRWKIQEGMLQLSEDGAQWNAVALSVTQNSNGYPIVTADGKEYSQC